jgi:hypothetical protein
MLKVMKQPKTHITGGKRMKKLLSISLVLILSGGLFLTESKKAEAMNNESTALLTASLVLFGIPIVSAITHDHYRPAPVYAGVYYDDSYPVQTRIIYRTPRYERHYWGRGQGYERGWRGPREYERDRDHERGNDN